MRVHVKKRLRHRKHPEDGITASACARAMRILDSIDGTRKEETEILEIIRETLEEMNIPFEEHFDMNFYCFMLLLHAEDPAETLRLRVILEGDPLICRIEAIYPFRVNLDYLMPVTCLIRDINYGKRFGSIHLDDVEGTLTYCYAFPTNRTHLEMVFSELLVAVVQSVNDRYRELRCWAGGHFHVSEKRHLLRLLNQQSLVLTNNISY